MGYAEVTTDVARAAQFIRDGRVVAFPTGTSYGLAVDALQGHALQRLRNLKHRPDEKTFTVFVRPELVPHFFAVTDEEQQLLKKYTNQALTVLLTPLAALEHLAQDSRVGLRVIDHPLMAALAAAVDVPLTATSANVTGKEPCFSVTEIEQHFPGILDDSDPLIALAGPTTYDLSLAAILDGGELPRALPTTVVKVEAGQIMVIRQGSVMVKLD